MREAGASSEASGFRNFWEVAEAECHHPNVSRPQDHRRTWLWRVHPHIWCGLICILNEMRPQHVQAIHSEPTFSEMFIGPSALKQTLVDQLFDSNEKRTSCPNASASHGF
jgi:hypothetical protein